MNAFERIELILCGIVDGFLLAFVILKFYRKELEAQDKFNKENQNLTPEERIKRFRKRVEKNKNGDSK